MVDPAKKKQTVMIDLEKLNTLNSEGRPSLNDTATSPANNFRVEKLTVWHRSCHWL
jgi:hypothetical protein